MSNVQCEIRTPWHLWGMGLLFIFLYGYGVYDYFMILGQNPEYYASNNYGEEVYEYFTEYPLLPLIFWTLNISCGFIAPIFLLFRKRWAVGFAYVSAFSSLCLTVITFGFMERWQVLGTFISLFDISILLLTFGLLLYAKAMVKKCVLK